MEEVSKKDAIQREALEAARPHKYAGLAISMGVGKTRIGLMHMLENFKSDSTFLVVAPKKSIFESWKEEAEKINASHLLKHITFSTYISLHKQSIGYTGVYLDECHNLKQSHEVFLEFADCKILGLTGTPPRNWTSEKGQMVNTYCPIVYKYVTDDAVDDGVLNDYKIVVHKIPMGTKKDMKMTTKSGSTFFVSEESQYDFWSRRILEAFTSKQKGMARIFRMKAMMKFPSKERYARHLMTLLDEKCLVFANTMEQADKLCAISYHSGNPNSEFNLGKFKDGIYNQMSCVLQISEGVNIPNLKSGIILHSYGNEVKNSQRLGRLFRLNPDETATAHILMTVGTVDEHWVEESLKDLDQSKITYVEPVYYE